MKHYKIILAGSLSMSTVVIAAPLNNVQQFIRCHLQLTDMEPDPTSQLYLDVASNITTAGAACSNVLHSATIDASGNLQPKNAVTLALLTKMNSLHSSWFQIHDYDTQGISNASLKQALWDPTGPALFYTKAMFGPAERFSDIFSGNKNLIARRELGSISDVALIGTGGVTKTVWSGFDPNDFVQSGSLNGIVDRQSQVINYTYQTTPAGVISLTGTVTVSGSMDFIRAFGGGILGSPAYLEQADIFPVYKPTTLVTPKPLDGGVEVQRDYGRHVMSDFLCRELPAVNIEDVDSTKYVDVASPVPFRNAAGCVVCHATMDQIGGTVRNIGSQTLGGYPYLGQNILNIKIPTTLGNAASYWNPTPDPTYSKRPPSGRLFYRTSSGELVNVSVNGLDELGAALQIQNDLYRCVVKRYYEYFVGVKIPWFFKPGDTVDPHQAAVLKLTEDLRRDQSLTRVVESILNSATYLKR
jgi:hypothetical protein